MIVINRSFYFITNLSYQLIYIIYRVNLINSIFIIKWHKTVVIINHKHNKNQRNFFTTWSSLTKRWLPCSSLTSTRNPIFLVTFTKSGPYFSLRIKQKLTPNIRCYQSLILPLPLPLDVSQWWHWAWIVLP